MKPTKSRIDKWKAKHEAMLKLAGESEAVAEAKEIGKVEDDELEDMDEGGHAADHERVLKAAAAAAAAAATAEASTSSANNHNDSVDHDDSADMINHPEVPELPNIDPDGPGVMINLGNGDSGAKSGRDGSASTRQQVQQALSV